ncbi:MAG TPA: hypothetical protein VHB79_37760 [Polyangiaceae bacterium]|nr:hypothetical protein [Polyangiaceae bacterium]
MVRQLLGAALVALIVGVGACSSTPLDSTEQGATEGELGSVNLPLTTQVGDVAYRLNTATFTITGPALGGKPRIVKPPADEPVHNEILPVGSYSIQLEKGWVLERRGPEAKVFTAVPATLVTPNPTSFDVNGKTPADAFFGFATVSGDVTLGNGSVNIRIGVEDCSSYDTYMAALGELTADCLGRVDPRDYEVTQDGIMRPKFAGCTVNEAKYTPILQLLSLQYRTARLPFAKQCMVGRFANAQAKLISSGLVDTCPSWKFAGYVNEITAQTIASVVKAGLPELPASDDVRPNPRIMEMLKQQSFYTVSLDNAPPQKCESPGRCATLCAAAFPGFLQSVDGNSVITDPTAWLSEAVYMSSTSDPYLRLGYYHPMSYYGPLPGALFGEYARFEPCGPLVSCSPEICSYYAGSHIKTFLQKDCLDPADITTCVSYCGPKLP